MPHTPQSLIVTARAHADSAAPATLPIALWACRLEGDLSGPECDTLARLAGSLIDSGAGLVTIEILTSTDPAWGVL